MSTRREIVILANSAKKGGHCVAGKDLVSGEWVRPVSTPEGGELTKAQVTLHARYSWAAKPLNRVVIDFDTPVPTANQPENQLIGPFAWEPKFKVDRTRLEQYLDTPEHIWQYSSKQDRVPYEIFNTGNIPHHQSLYLIKVPTLQVGTVLNSQGWPRVQGTFAYNGVTYTFNITDPAYCRYKQGPLGTRVTEHDKYLCLSLSEKFEATGDCYKLIAAVL